MRRTRRRPLAPLALVTGALVGCSFQHGKLTSAHDDASTLPVEDARIDAPIDAMIDAPPDASLIAGCPPAPNGCTLFGCAASAASCYYYCPMASSFSAASSRCASIGQGGCLVTLNDAAEDECVRLAAGSGGLIYIGLVQSASGSEPAGGWGWACGTSTYGPNWTGNEPNDAFPGEDCGAMNTLGGWVDVTCSETFRHVCEVPRP